MKFSEEYQDVFIFDIFVFVCFLPTFFLFCRAAEHYIFSTAFLIICFWMLHSQECSEFSFSKTISHFELMSLS